MSELRQTARLEAEGRYYDGLSARPRTVTLGFGERSLTMTAGDGEVVGHWPLATLRSLSAASERTQQLVPGDGSEERVLVADEAMIRAIERVCPDLYRAPSDRRGARTAVVWLGAAAAALAVVVFVLVPNLSNQLALLVPPEREAALGESLRGQLREILDWSADEGESVAFCIAPDGLDAIAKMEERLDPRTMPYPLEIAVIDHDVENALALPGGHIVLFRGLIDAAGSAEEVAGVLAHEIGHVVHRDPTRGVLRAAGTAGILGLLVGDVVGGGVTVAATEAVLNASYQREAETRADETAYALMNEAGLPVTAFAGFFERMREKHGDGSSGALRYFASHPGIAGRAERAAAADRVGKDFVPVLTPAEWQALKNICSQTEAPEDEE